VHRAAELMHSHPEPPMVGATEPAHWQKKAVRRKKFFNLNFLLSDQPCGFRKANFVLPL